jgi:hypothetical protein
LPKEGTPPGNARLRTEADFVNRTVDPATASKVVDENGEPMVMYHGTNTEFSTFDLSKGKTFFAGKGFYFTTSSDFAATYGSKKTLAPSFQQVAG